MFHDDDKEWMLYANEAGPKHVFEKPTLLLCIALHQELCCSPETHFSIKDNNLWLQSYCIAYGRQCFKIR
jgi:hypothetical protein